MKALCTNLKNVIARAGGTIPAPRALALVGVIMMSTLAISGCSTVTVEESLTKTLASDDAETQMDFWHDLYEQRLTSNDDAFHGILLFLDGQDKSPDYETRVGVLKARNLLHQGFNEPADHAVRRGTVAVIVYHALEMKGGLVVSLAPFSPRYTMRELQYVGIFPQSSERQTLSGGQFVSLLGRVDDYRNSRPIELQAADPPPEDIREQDRQPQPEGKDEGDGDEGADENNNKEQDENAEQNNGN